MILRDIIELLGGDVVAAYGDGAYAPSGVACDHRKVAPGGLFVCIEGFVADGHNFAAGAIENGAAVIITQKPAVNLNLPQGVKPAALIQVKDSRKALAAAAQLFYGEPTKKLSLAGITGTKGKTTTVYMIRSILQAAGIKTGMVGTIENDVGGEITEAAETTPESVELAAIFSKMLKNGCSHAVMEVSSQGLALSRVGYCDFDIGVFLNLYKDHISPHEHANIDEYFAAKKKLFGMCKNAVINGDAAECGAVGEMFAKNGGRGAALIYSADESDINHARADVRASGIELLRGRGAHTRFNAETPWFNETVTLGLPGRYNVSNALAAISVCGLLGIPKSAIAEGLRNAKVRGRTQAVDAGQDFTVLVDYAHNAASLEALLNMLREYRFTSITTVFGCGGNRARDRRFDMGEVSGRLSDFTIVTSDNPRKEAPGLIIADIETGLRRTNGKYIRIEDRREAIGYAINNAAKGDLVLIAGKGHETGQTFADRTVPFDDVTVASEFILAK